MGYWSESREGDDEAQATLLWGDHPADIFGDAIDHIKVAFLRDVRRLPTREELRRGLEFSLRAEPLPETYPALEHSDETLKPIDDFGYAAFSEDQSYRGLTAEAFDAERQAHAKLRPTLDEVQKPYRKEG